MTEGREDIDTTVARYKVIASMDRRAVLEKKGMPFVKASSKVIHEIKDKRFDREGWELRRVADHLVPEKNNN